MSRDDFELTKDSLRMPYVRFLSDSAGGYVLILVIAIILLSQNPSPFEWVVWKNVQSAGITTAFLFGLGIILLVLGAPIGILLNATSWFLLGSYQIKFANMMVHTRLSRIFPT